MNISENTKLSNREKLIETLFEITQSDKSEIKFKSIAWDNNNPILLLKGLNETPDFTIFFGLDESDPTRACIFPDDEPECDLDFETTYLNIKKFTPKMLMTLVKDILTACSLIMLRLGINCYLAHYQDDYGWLKLTPTNKVVFLSDNDSIEIDIKNITNASLWDYVGVPELSDTILIKTDSGKSYSMALEKADEFARKLEEKINEVRNIESRLAS